MYALNFRTRNGLRYLADGKPRENRLAEKERSDNAAIDAESRFARCEQLLESLREDDDAATG